jgi:fructoselysine-6-P-deglycase FrlB-like protein/predicted TIM-barrel fold metal-dependent hydrolase
MKTWDEIQQQPWLWRETARRVSEFAEPMTRLLRQFDVLAPGMVPDGFLVFSGLGSSHYIGRMIELRARAALGAYVMAVSSSDLILTPDAHLPRDRRGILMSFSRSGESPEVVEAARRVAKDFPRVAHVVVTCNAKGTLGRECRGLNVTLHDKACDRGLAMTSSVTSMVLAGRFLVSPFDPAAFIGETEKLASECDLEGLSKRAEAVAKLDPQRIVILGGAQATEAALKIMELTDGQVATLAQGFLDVRHGPLSFVNERTVVIGCVSADEPLARYERDLLASLKGKCLDLIELRHSDVLLDVVFAQLVGFHLSTKLGLDPDNPSKRGIITRVVQGVTVYPAPPRAIRNPVAEELARRGGETLALKDYQPVSMLKTPETTVNKPRFAVIDAHSHIDGEDPRALVRIMDECGVEKIVNLSAAIGDEAKRVLDTFTSDRFATMVTPDWNDPKALRELLQRGAVGIKIFKARHGKLLAADDPSLDPIWDMAAEFNKPVAIHIGDPRAFFEPFDRFNERFEEQAAHPDWRFDGRWEEILEGRDRLFERRKDVRWISVHVGGAPEDLDNASRMLDRFPHVVVDLAARVAELGRQPYRAREFLIRYADRVLFGTDLPPHVEMYRAHYRFLETFDEYFDYPSHASRQGRWKIYGMKLPDEVLKKIYSENARRILH